MPSGEIIKIAENTLYNGFIQWLINSYGWAILVIGGLASYIWRDHSKRVSNLEDDMGKARSKKTCDKFMDKLEVDCDKDTDTLRADMNRGFSNLGKSVTGIHERLDVVILGKNKKRSDT